MQAPDLKQAGKDPLPVIKRRRKQMERKLERGQRREERRTEAKLRSDRNRKEVGRKLRQEQKKVWQASKREQNRARQLNEASSTKQASSATKPCLPPRRHTGSPENRLPKCVRKLLMVAPQSAVKSEQKRARRSDKEATSGGGREARCHFVRVAGDRMQRMQKLRQRRRLTRKAEAVRRAKEEAKVLVGNQCWKFCFFGSEPKIHSFFLAPKARKSRHFLHRDKSA